MTALTISLIVFLCIYFYFRTKSEEERKTNLRNKLKIISKEITDAEEKKEKIRDDSWAKESFLRDEIERIYGSEARESFKNHFPFKGMPKTLLIYSMGHPYYTENSKTPTGISDIYYYDKIFNARSNARRKYYKIIKLENNIVTWWDILETN